MLKSSLIREVTLYRYRYLISYGFFAILLFGLLLFGINEIPRGLTNGEMNSAVDSVNIDVFSPRATNVIDAPYHLLQKASIHIFGLTPLAIKLPSVIIGVITGLTLIIMLQRWFKRNVAVVTATVLSTSTGFLSISRMGEPVIMTTFWMVILLLASTFFLHSNRGSFLWKLVCFVSVALLLYSPLGVYPLIAMLIAGIVHPHVRWRVTQGKWWHFVLIGLAFVIAVAPLAIAIAADPAIALRLIGLSDTTFTMERFWNGARASIESLFNITHSQVGPITTPIFGAISLALLLLGFLKLCTAAYSARSYMLFIWLFLLIPVLVLNPSAVTLALAPAALIMAIGIETLIREWYGLFPRNPYARIGALVPLSILIISVVFMNVERYYYGNHYSPVSAQVFHTELPAIREALVRKDINQNNVRVVVPGDQTGFYDILRREYKQLAVSDTLGDTTAKASLIVTANSPQQPIGAVPYRIITNDLRENPVQVRIFTRW